MGDFRKLQVWELAKTLTVKIYKLVKTDLVSKDYGYKDQIQRACRKYSTNIAEGDELGTDKQSIRHFYIAKGSAAELQTLLIIGSEIGYLEPQLTNDLINECKVISVMLLKIIKARS